MRQHTVIGERIISAAPALAIVGGLVRATQERHDGGGYPDGLAGDQVPLVSRIVAVCTAFDAMVSDRPYRTPRSPSEAVTEIQRGSGTQFDPTVVDAFLTALAHSADRVLVDAHPAAL
jgi:HD-GYP domain-containing protein (c-di-GMP phosphodiesterase class II)